MMIDWDRVTELQDEIGEEDFIEVGRMFIAEMQEKLEAMGELPAPGTEDYHYLRGSAANLGLAEFADLCGTAEAAAKSGETTDLAAIQASFDRAIAEIADLFEG